MIYMGQNGESAQIHKKKFPPAGTPENTERTFTISRCALFWEVRCVSRAAGKVTGDQLVATLPTEQDAEAMARELADPAIARKGRFILEELIEEGRDERTSSMDE